MQASKPTSPRPANRDNDVIVCLSESGSGFTVIAVRRAASSVAVLAEAVLESADAAAAFANRNRASRVVHIVPASDTIVRLADLPVGDAGQMSSAAELMAEAELPASLPEHRRAGGLLPGASMKAGMRTALLCGWVNRPQSNGVTSGGVASRQTAGAGDLPASFCPSVAALAMLTGGNASGGFCETEHQAFAVFASGPERAAARVVIEDESDQASMLRKMQAALTAAATSCGVQPSTVSGVLTLDAAARTSLGDRVKGVRDEQAWLDRYGILVGAALAWFNSEMTPLASLLAAAPVVVEPAPIAAARWLNSGTRAVLITTVSCAAILFLPLAIGAARDQVLSGRVSVIEDMKKNSADVEKQAALYAQLDISRWPLTKLLSDISVATPVGVTATDVRLSPEQGLTFQGTAKTPELVNSFQANLGQTKLFMGIKLNRTETNSEGVVEFNLTAEVVPGQAHTPVKPIDDFSKNSLSMRLHGVEVTAGNAGDAKGDAKNGHKGERRGDGKVEEPDSRRPLIASDTLPAVVTDEQIKKMDKETATREWISRKVYVQKNPTLDSATKARLGDEEARIKAHSASLPAASGGAK